MVPGVGHDDAPFLIHRHSLRAQELPVAGALGAQEARRLAVRVDDQEAMVVEVRHYQVALVIERHASGGIKVLPEYPFEAVLVQEHAVGPEQLNAMVPRVRDQDLALCVDGHVPRVIELPVLCSFLPELQNELPLEREDLDAMIVLVGHDDPARNVAGHAGGAIELARPGAQRAKLVMEGPARLEHLDAVVAAVGDDDEALLVDADPPGAAELAVAVSLAAEGQPRQPDADVAAPGLHHHFEGAVLDVLVAHHHGHQVLSLQLGTVADQVGPVLLIADVCPEKVSVGAHDHGRDHVTPREARLPVVVVADHGERGHLALQSTLETFPRGFGQGSKSPAADKAHGFDGHIQCLVREGEHDPIVFLWLEKASDVLQLLHLSQHAVPSQENVHGATLLQDLLNSTNGVIQLVQVLT